LLGALLSAALLAQPGVASVAADEAYSDALRYMKSLPEPAQLNYAVALTASNGNFFLQKNASGREAQIGFSVGGDEVTTTNLRALASRGETATVITFDDGTQARTTYRFFNALWSSAYDWLRYGIDAQSVLPSVGPSASPAPFASPPAALPLNLIAQVSAFDTGHYRVADAGTAPCDNGDEGRVLSLSARTDPDQHPLTRAVVDVQSASRRGVRTRADRMPDSSTKTASPGATSRTYSAPI